MHFLPGYVAVNAVTVRRAHEILQLRRIMAGMTGPTWRIAVERHRTTERIRPAVTGRAIRTRAVAAIATVQ